MCVRHALLCEAHAIGISQLSADDETPQQSLSSDLLRLRRATYATAGREGLTASVRDARLALSTSVRHAERVADFGRAGVAASPSCLTVRGVRRSALTPRRAGMSVSFEAMPTPRPSATSP